MQNVRQEDTGYYICSFNEKSASVFLGIANRDDPITIVRIDGDKKLVNALEGLQTIWKFKLQYSNLYVLFKRWTFDVKLWSYRRLAN